MDAVSNLEILLAPSSIDLIEIILCFLFIRICTCINLLYAWLHWIHILIIVDVAHIPFFLEVLKILNSLLILQILILIVYPLFLELRVHRACSSCIWQRFQCQFLRSRLSCLWFFYFCYSFPLRIQRLTVFGNNGVLNGRLRDTLSVTEQRLWLNQTRVFIQY
jgi:hypothetical protein